MAVDPPIIEIHLAFHMWIVSDELSRFVTDGVHRNPVTESALRVQIASDFGAGIIVAARSVTICLTDFCIQQGTTVSGNLPHAETLKVSGEV